MDAAAAGTRPSDAGTAGIAGAGDDAVNQERGEHGHRPPDAGDATSAGAFGGGWEDAADESATQGIRRRSAAPGPTQPQPKPSSHTPPPTPQPPSSGSWASAGSTPMPGSFAPAGAPPPADSYRPGYATGSFEVGPEDHTVNHPGPTRAYGGYEALYPSAASGGFDRPPSPSGSGQHRRGDHYSDHYSDHGSDHGGHNGSDYGGDGDHDAGGHPWDGYPADDEQLASGPAGTGPAVEPAPRRPGRLATILTLVALLLAVLFVVGDRVTVAVAERQMASQLKTSVLESVPCGTAPPTVKNVSIGGFPFLTQVLFGKFKDIGLTVENLPTTELTIESIQAHMRGIHLPLSQIISGNVGEVRVDDVQGTVRVSYDELNKFLATQTGEVQVHPVDGGRKVEITATVDVPLVGAQQVGGVTTFEVRNNQLTLVPSELKLSGILNFDLPLGGLGELLPTIALPVGDLPFKLVVTKASTDATGLAMAATATDVVLPKMDSTVVCKQ